MNSRMLCFVLGANTISSRAIEDPRVATHEGRTPKVMLDWKFFPTNPRPDGAAKDPQIRRQYITQRWVDEHGVALGCPRCEGRGTMTHSDTCRKRFEEIERRSSTNGFRFLCFGYVLTELFYVTELNNLLHFDIDDRFVNDRLAMGVGDRWNGTGRWAPMMRVKLETVEWLLEPNG